jgi:hypothetical protein
MPVISSVQALMVVNSGSQLLPCMDSESDLFKKEAALRVGNTAI